ncbi:hypothetical protein EDD17DRAFT_1506016 [Pisolithus thermaeus]|nr:hypothetical protein EDD17DRAFT_1506016 [Pisolithus thermaeus]
MALYGAGIMPAIINLANGTAWLVKWGNIYDSSQEAGPSWVDSPLTLVVPPPSSLWGRIQAKPVPQVEPVGKGKAKAPSVDNQAVPDPGPEDEITSAGIYDNIAMVINITVQGTLFPEFTGYENPHRVLTLGQGKDGVRMILFVRANNNLYACSDEGLSTALNNIHQGTPPPVPTRMEATCLGLPESVPEERGAKRQRKGMKGGRYLQATTHQGQLFHPRGGGHPSGRKTRGGIPELPQEAPPLNAPVQDWVKFIQTYQNRYSSSDESSELLRMFPGVLGISKHPDDDEWEISPPSTQMVQGFLLYE